MKRVSWCLSLALQLLFWSCLPVAGAQECEFKEAGSPTGYLAQISRMSAPGAGCFAGPRDTSTLYETVKSRLANFEKEPATREQVQKIRDELIAILRLVQTDVTRRLLARGDPWDRYAGIMLGELSTAIEEIRRLRPVVRAEYWQPVSDPKYGFFEQKETGVLLIVYEDQIVEDCGADFSDLCRRTLDSAGNLERYAAIVRRVLQLPVRATLDEIYKQVSALDDQWDYYFGQARSQYFWESMANNAIYDPPGNRLAGPPDAQLILFHPTVAMEYVGSGPQNESAYDAVGIVELIGYNQWSYKAGSFLKRWPLGISAVATYTPETTGDRVGYGAVIHIKQNLSIGATRRDTGDGTETTWLLSVDFMKLFLEKSAEEKEAFRFGKSAPESE